MKIGLFLICIGWVVTVQAQFQLPYFQDFEQTPDTVLFGNQLPLPGAPNMSIFTVQGGRVQSRALPGYVFDGKRSLTLDEPNQILTQNDLVLRLNLKAYQNDDLELYFHWTDFGEQPSTGDGVWVRGNASQTWTLIYDLSARLFTLPDGFWRFSGYLDLDSALTSVGTAVDTTFEVRFGQHGGSKLATVISGGGISWDNIGIQKVTQNDGSVKDILPFCEGLSPVHFRLQNKGSDTLSSATVQWSVNGIAQAPFRISGLQLQKEQDTLLALGNYTFNAGQAYDVKVEVDSVNQVPDAQSSNNSFQRSGQLPSLSGSYVVGTGGDFGHLNAALQTLESVGSCGPVTLLILDTTYTPAVVLRPYRRLRETDSLRISSHPNNLQPAVLEGGVRIEGLQYLRMDHLELAALQRIIDIPFSSSHLEFDHNVFRSKDTVVNLAVAIHNALTIHVNHLNIHHNTFNKPNVAMLLRGFHSQGHYLSRDWTIDSNLVQQYGLYGFNLSNVYGLSVNGNRIASESPSTGGAAIDVTYGTRIQMQGNNITTFQPFQIVRLVNINSSGWVAGDSLILINNLIYGGDYRGSGFGAGVKLINTEYGRVSHNTIHCGFSCFETQSLQQFEISNNIFSGNTSQLIRIRTGSTFGIQNAHNVYWTGSSTWKGVLSGVYDPATALFVDPWFEDTEHLLMTPGNPALDSAGKVVFGVTHDLNGRPRTPGFPDIGALEFTPCAHDLHLRTAALEFDQVPIGQSIQLNTTVFSTGTDSVTGVQISNLLNSQNQQTILPDLASRKDHSQLIRIPYSGTTGSFTLQTQVNIQENDCRTYNDSLRSDLTITDTILARPYDTSSMVLAPLKWAEIGQEFHLTHGDTLTGMGVYLNPRSATQLKLFIYQADTFGNPGSVLDSSEIQSFASSSNGSWASFPLRCKGLVLDTGKFFAVWKIYSTSLPLMAFGDDLQMPGRTVILEHDTFVKKIDFSIRPQFQGKTLMMEAYFGHPNLQRNLFATDTLTMCYEDTLLLQPLGTGYTNWQWDQGPNTRDYSVHSAGTYKVRATDSSNCSFTDHIYVDTLDRIPWSALVIPAQCKLSNGSISPILNGPHNPYSFSWKDGATSLNRTAIRGGRYILTLGDTRGCFQTAVIDVPGGDPVLVLGAQPNTCASDSLGQAHVQVTQGSAPYTYVWNNGDTLSHLVGLKAGSYSVTVTDSLGCTSMGNVTIADSSNFATQLLPVAPTLCQQSDGRITAAASGGVPPYSYAWNDPAQQKSAMAIGLSKGLYTVSITDSTGCVLIQSIRLKDPNSPELVVITPNLKCHGDTGSIHAVVQGGTAPFRYYWQQQSTPSPSSLSGVTSGSYQVRVVDTMGCDYDTSFTLIEPDSLAITFDNYIDLGTNFSLRATTLGGTRPFRSWTWSNGETDSVALNLPHRTAYVTVVDLNHCTRSDTFYVNIFGVGDLSESGIRIYPNPSSGTLFIETPVAQPSTELLVKDIQGRQVYQFSWDKMAPGTEQIEIARLSEGVYLLHLQQGNKHWQKRLLIRP